MILDLFQRKVTVKIVSANISETINLLCGSGIEILDYQSHSELEAEVTILFAKYDILNRICEKRGDSVQIVSRRGLFWQLHVLANRGILFTFMVLYFAAVLVIPSRIFFVRVAGNATVPSRLILEAAEISGIKFGAFRRDVRSEKVKNALLDSLPQLQWAGVNTDGCVAEISVRERSVPEKSEGNSAFGHITACRDGIILSTEAHRGTLLCVPGQAVSEGEILISGYTDCGLTIRAEQARGEIFAVTRREINAIAPTGCGLGVENGTVKRKFSVLIGKKRINLWKYSGFWDTSCDRMYEENYITLPGGFQLPFGWAVETFLIRNVTQAVCDTADTESLLRESAEQYLKCQMLSGTIRKSEISFSEAEGILQMAGQYSCVEMIGIMQRLEIGETNEQDN